VAHTGKDRDRGLRGSSGFFAGFDTILAMNTTQDAETLLHTAKLTVEKQKDGVSGMSYWFASREVTLIAASADCKSLVLDRLMSKTASGAWSNASR
jgi:hypothetical protein